MIVVTRPGLDPKKQPHTFECLNCGCIAECFGEDIIYEDRPCSSGYIECPTCGNHMRQRAPEKKIT